MTNQQLKAIPTVKINKAKKYILEKLSAIDTSEYNTKYYKNAFDNMSNEDFVKFVMNKELKVLDDFIDSNITYTNLMKLSKSMGIRTTERVTLPHVYRDDKGNPIVSDNEVLVLPLHIRKLSQTIFSKNKVALNSDKRNKFNQPVDASKGARVNKEEANILLAGGYNNVLKEFYTMRSGHDVSEKLMHKAIQETGKVSLNEVDYLNPDGKRVVKYMDALYKSVWLVTDLVDDPKRYTSPIK